MPDRKTRMTAAAGDEVRVFDVNGRRNGQPPGGWPGEIIKAGPKLVTIRYNDPREAGHSGGRVFRREDGQANDRHGHQSFVTPGEAAEALALARALDQLDERGITVTGATSLTIAQVVRLANAAAAFPAGHPTVGESGLRSIARQW